MNVLRVIASMDPSMGGPPQGIRNSIGELERLGIHNEVVCCDAPDAAWLGRDSFSIYTLGPGKYGFAYTPKLGPWLEENLSRFDAVIVHGLWLWPSVCATRAVARERARRKAEGKRQEAKGEKQETGGGRLSAESLNPQHVTLNSKQLRCFVMPHGMLDPWFQRDKSRRVKAVRNWLYWWLVERGVVNSADAMLFTCQQELELARTTFGGYRPKQEVNVGYGIAEPPAFEPKTQEAFAARCPGLNGRPYLLFMSRIHAKKNVATLVRAYARVRSEVTRTGVGGDRSPRRPNEWRVTSGQSSEDGPGGVVPPPQAKRAEPKSAVADVDGRRQTGGFPDLVIAGPGWDSDYGRKVRGLIDEANRSIASAEHRTLSRGLGRQPLGNTEHSACVHAVAMLSGDAKWGSLYGCEAFVLPSHQENFGIAVVEALACGKPVLISDQVNIWREIVEDGAGLVEADTEEGVEKLLRKFFDSRRAEDGWRMEDGRWRMADGGGAPRECYLKRFAIGPAAAKLARALKS